MPVSVGDGLYDVYVMKGSDWVLLKSGLATGEVLDFTKNSFAAGVDQFQIRGIELSADVSAYDVTAFITGLTFFSEGNFTGSMAPIAVTISDVSGVPEPTEAVLLLMGLAFLSWTLPKKSRTARLR